MRNPYEKEYSYHDKSLTFRLDESENVISAKVNTQNCLYPTSFSFLVYSTREQADVVQQTRDLNFIDR